jgi:hypothetical protein
LGSLGAEGNQEGVHLFFYDKGGRSRSSLKEFLGDAKIDALQSDAYNVYMYLDDEVMDVDHLSPPVSSRATPCWNT